MSKTKALERIEAALDAYSRQIEYEQERRGIPQLDDWDTLNAARQAVIELRKD